MIRRSGNILFCVAILSSSLIARAADTATNPAYGSWAKSGVGTVLKYSQATEAMGNKSTGEMTETLTELTPDEAKVEIKMSMTVGANKMDLPAKTTTIPAKIAGSATPATAPAGDAPKIDQTKEDVTIDGKIYPCTVTTVNTNVSGMKVISKIWSCVDVPGSLIKSESSTSGAVTSHSVLALISIGAK